MADVWPEMNAPTKKQRPMKSPILSATGPNHTGKVDREHTSGSQRNLSKKCTSGHPDRNGDAVLRNRDVRQ